MSLRERQEPVSELDLLIRNSLKTSVRNQHPKPDLRRQLLRRASERPRGRWLWLPISTPEWINEPRFGRSADQGLSGLVYLSAPRVFRLMGFPSQIL
jgi:hypothetical protein